MEERILGKPSTPSTPLLSSLHSASAVEAFLQPHINFLKTYPRVREYKKKTLSWWILMDQIMHGASIFSF